MTSAFHRTLPKPIPIVVIALLLAAKTACAQDSTTKTKMPQTLYGFTQPSPMDFNDHEGYVSLFDGKDLKDWDGNPKF